MSNSQLSDYCFLFAHGAGADKDSEWMLEFDRILSSKGLQVIRFNFPYMIKRAEEGGRRPPDRAPKLLAAFKQQIDLIPKHKKLIIGGKSMGGRMASLLASESELTEPLERKLSAVVCLGYPFHPPKKLEKFKGAHLADIGIKTLILQGERDTMGTKAEIADYPLSESVCVEYLNDGDHSFKPRVKSGFSLEQNRQLAADIMICFINQL